METRLKRLTRERGMLRYSQFRTAFTRTARELRLGDHDVGRRQYERWLAGQLRGLPRPAACDVLEALFGEPVEQLFMVECDLPNEPVAGYAAADTPLITDRVGLGGVGSKPSASPADVPASRCPSQGVREMMMAAAEQSRHKAAQADAILGSYTMEQLEADVVQLARDYMRRPPIALFIDAVRTRDQVFACLDEARRPDQIKDLSFLAGILSGLLSQICIDFGQWRPGADHARAAWTYANTIGHSGLAGWARGMQATVAFWDRRPKEAVLAIRRGTEHVSAGPLAVRLYSLAARAWSHGGNVDRTVRAVRAAEDTRGGSDMDDELHDSVGGLFRWDTARQEMCAVDAYLQLVDLRQRDLDQMQLRWLTDQVVLHGQRALAASLTAAPGARSATLETSMRLDVATAYTLLGDERRVQETLAGIFDLPADRHTYPLLYRLGRLRAELGRLSQRWARELCAQIQDATGAATPLQAARSLLPGMATCRPGEPPRQPGARPL
ncbi:MAG: hypothetical protein ACRDYA_20385 [Egibacteraceae bacterium]